SELWSAPTDASSAPVRLNGAGVAGPVYSDYSLSPDGRWVVYRAEHDAAGEIDLYSAPSDGHAPARRLNLPRPLADVLDFQIAFDGLGVVYRADQDTDDVPELYAVVIDGSSVPVKRSDPAAHGVGEFRLAASTDRLVYVASTKDVTGFHTEVHSVSAIHGGPPVRLVTVPAAAGLRDLLVSADGARVVYGSNVEGYWAFYGVPSDGSTPAVRLSDAGQSVELGESELVQIVAGTGRVLYVSAGPELHSVLLDGSQPAIR